MIEQGACGIEGNTTLQRWAASEHGYTERFLHIFSFSNFLIFNSLLKDISHILVCTPFFARINSKYFSIFGTDPCHIHAGWGQSCLTRNHGL